MTSKKSVASNHDDITDGRIVSSRHLVSERVCGAIGAGIRADHDQQRV